MKIKLHPLFIRLVLLASLVQTQMAYAAVTFNLTPSAVSNTYSGYITLQIGGIPNGDTVVVQKFLDLNTNGVIDSGDLLIQQFNLTDGQAGMVISGVTNINVPGDLNATPGAITAALNFQSGDFVQNIVGKYLYKLSSPVGHFPPLTNQFVVTNYPFPQRITGNVFSNGTSTLVPNAIVLLLQPQSGRPDGPGNETCGVVANSVGSYSIQLPPGTYNPVPVAGNYVFNFTASPLLTLAANQTITTNLILTNATSTISGQVVDVTNSSMGLPGVWLHAENAPNSTDLIAFTVTDSNGAFNLPVTPSKWRLIIDSRVLNVHGYVGSGNGVIANGGSTGVTMPYAKATALFYGSVIDNLGNPLAGVDVSANDTNEVYDAECNTDTNGNYVLGVVGGLTNDPWGLSCGDNASTNYNFSLGNYNLYFGGTNLNNGMVVLQNFTGILATNQITGSFKDNNGKPIVDVGIWGDATINGVYYHVDSVNTDAQGNYALNVCNGTWEIGGFPNLSSNYTVPYDQDPVISNNNAVVNFTATNLTTPPVYSGLALNGGFESGDFSGWTLIGDSSYTFVDTGSRSETIPYSGNYEAALGTSGALGYLSQPLVTTAGAHYSVSLWLYSDGQTPNEFSVSWNGNTLYDEQEMSPFGWTNLQFSVSATESTSFLEFGFRDDPGFLELDQISVGLAPPGIASVTPSGTNLVLNGINGQSGGTYYVLASTNLTLPLNQWTRVATNTLNANGNFTITVTNTVNPSVAKRFYILQGP